jgi:hypothetical protein
MWGPAGGGACGDMLKAKVRIAPSQPNEAMARIAPRRNGTISLDLNFRVKISEKGSLDVDSKLFSKVQIDSKRGLGLRGGSSRPGTRTHNFAFSVGAIPAEPPCSVAFLKVNSEPHTGARHSARLCVGLMKTKAIFLKKYIARRLRSEGTRPLLINFRASPF